jgi:hypothetical protein
MGPFQPQKLNQNNFCAIPFSINKAWPQNLCFELEP